ncbi:hypothetical protein TRAPUB_6378 [Trametes pubescens]|uniref:F-box domain-containing protein n=1 Tax=Trametes pubescens TaxID=154538 RepID=A0A1M2V623_TRAPU|nr:hypothetical protein TRAPUB_6378 [Trametes pubescens]
MSSQPPEQDGSSPIAGSVQSTTKPERDRESEGSKQSAVQEELMHRPLVDIAVELRRLREENELLRVEKQRLDALLPVTATLRAERAVFKGTVRYFMDQTGIVSSTARRPPTNPGQLPYDVLLPILRASRAPFYELDPSVAQGSKSRWLAEQRYRKGLLLVCKRWMDPATRVFYEDIVLRRVGQIFALAAALETHKDLARMVKTIRLDTCVVPQGCADAARDALQSIFSLCTALRRFEYHTAEHFPVALSLPAAGDVYGAFSPAWFVDDSSIPFLHAYQQRLSTLQILDLAMPLSHKQVALLHGLLSGAICLDTLKIGTVLKAEGGEDLLGPLPVLQLPRLKELYIPVDEAGFVAYASTTWEMPALERLTTLHTLVIPLAFLTAHGSHLRYLHLCPRRKFTQDWRWGQANSEGIERIAALCPLIEHLALYSTRHSAENLIAMFEESSKLRYMDLYTAAAYPWYDTLPNNEGAVSVRYLWIVHSDLPAVCDPRILLAPSAASASPSIVHIRALRLLCSSNSIVPDVEQHTSAFPPLAFDDDDEDMSGTYEQPRSETSQSEGSDYAHSEGSSSKQGAEAERDEEEEEKETDEDRDEEEDDDDDDDEDDDGSEGLSEHESDCWQPDEQLDRNAVLQLFRSSCANDV